MKAITSIDQADETTLWNLLTEDLVEPSDRGQPQGSGDNLPTVLSLVIELWLEMYF